MIRGSSSLQTWLSRNSNHATKRAMLSSRAAQSYSLIPTHVGAQASRERLCSELWISLSSHSHECFMTVFTALFLNTATDCWRVALLTHLYCCWRTTACRTCVLSALRPQHYVILTHGPGSSNAVPAVTARVVTPQISAKVTSSVGALSAAASQRRAASSGTTALYPCMSRLPQTLLPPTLLCSSRSPFALPHPRLTSFLPSASPFSSTPRHPHQ